MAFIDDVKPLLPVFFRLVAIWVEIVVFALGLLTRNGLIVFVPAGVLLIYDIAVTALRYKVKRTARRLDQDYIFTPQIWTIALDCFTTGVFLAIWILHTWDLVNVHGGWMLDGYVLVGELVIVHLHLFFAATEIHLLRQRKNGAAAARRAEHKNQAKSDVELTTTPIQPDGSQSLHALK